MNIAILICNTIALLFYNLSYFSCFPSSWYKKKLSLIWAWNFNTNYHLSVKWNLPVAGDDNITRKRRRDVLLGAKWEFENCLLFFVKRRDLKTNEWTKWVIQLGNLGVENQPLENFANLNLLKAGILPFWCLKKANLKG